MYIFISEWGTLRPSKAWRNSRLQIQTPFRFALLKILHPAGRDVLFELSSSKCINYSIGRDFWMANEYLSYGGKRFHSVHLLHRQHDLALLQGLLLAVNPTQWGLLKRGVDNHLSIRQLKNKWKTKKNRVSPPWLLLIGIPVDSVSILYIWPWSSLRVSSLILSHLKRNSCLLC